MNKIHRRQFIIGPSKEKTNKKWRVLQLNDNVFLSYCESLPVKQGYDKNGNSYVLIGIAVQIDPKRGNPLNELENSVTSPENLYDSWSGRWILIFNNELHLDISGLLGCYYTEINGDLWISSSISLLSKLSEKKNTNESVLSESRMNWFPLPSSSQENMRSLLPSQIMIITSGKIKVRQLFPEKMISQSEEEAITKISEYLKTGLKNVSKMEKNLWIPLSAGYDSRLLLATAVSAEVPVKSYTMIKRNTLSFFNRKPQTSLVSKADMTIPPLLAKEVGVSHKWINQKEFNPDSLKRFDKHVHGQTIENDRVYYSYGQWDWVGDNDLILLGQVFEMGHCHYYDSLEYSNNIISKKSIVENFELKKNDLQSKSLDEYILWLSKYNDTFKETVDWRDRFYLEQRLAGWLSSLQQGLDLINGERVHLANSQRLICTLLSLPTKTRKNLTHQEELIKRMAPDLLKYPFNPPDPFLYKVYKLIALISRKPLKAFFTKRFIKKIIKK